MFTLQMAGLDVLAPDTTWPVIFQTPDFVDRFVRMSTDAAAVVSFEHGLGTNPSSTETPGTPADPSSSFDADGTIRIVVPGNQLGDPQPGQFISQFLSRIRLEAGPVGAVTPDNMPSDLSRAGFYEVANCATVPTIDVSISEVKDTYRNR